MTTNIQGVDLKTGKLLLSINLASLSGPNNFGEILGIQYSSLGLLPLIKTWNQDAPTGILGLGWSLTVPAIMRIGSGSIYDTFLLSGQKLIPTSIQVSEDKTFFTAQFVTATKSLQQITYTTNNETWTIVDADGTTFIYGCNEDAMQKSVRWLSQSDAHGNQTPAAWIGTSVQNSQAQDNFVLIWSLAKKINIYGQEVNFSYTKQSQNVGQNGGGLSYDLASYLTSISVVNGQSLQIFYSPKNSWEYPPLRKNYEDDGSVTNAYQDRIETQYLSSIQLYDELGQLQTIISLNYSSLWQNNTCYSPTSTNPINKRLLTSITATTPDGYEITPAEIFDYWGCSVDDGYNVANFPISQNLLQITNADIDGSSFGLEPYEDPAGNTYTQLFGHLKSFKSATGAMTWYSYLEVEQNYSKYWSDFNYQWINQLSLTGIGYPDGQPYENSSWTSPRPFWGPDGYLVLRWDSQDKNSNGYYTIHVDIYEWLGYWQKVDIQNYTDLEVSGREESESYDFSTITTGVGFVTLLRTDIADPTYGAVTLFTRNPYLPGQWTAYYFEQNTKIASGYSLPGYNYEYVYPEVNISNNIVAISDRVNGNLYAYGWNGNSWDQSGSISVGTIGENDIGSITTNVLGRDVFVLYVLNSQTDVYPQCSIYTYNPLATSTPWQASVSSIPLNFYLLENNSSDSNLFSLESSPGDGYIFVSPVITTVTQADYCKPFIISWDDQYNIYCQKILNQGKWAFDIDDMDSLPWQGFANISNFGNNIYYAASDQKIAFRYIGSGVDNNNNLGWCAMQMSNNITNDDYFGSLLLLDNTIAPSGDKDISYTFYQYDPTTNTWQTAPEISQNLSTRTDWNEVISIVLFSVQIGTMFLSFLGPFGEAYALIGNILVIPELVMPITAVVSRVVGTLAPYLFSEVVAEATIFLTDQIVGQAEGIAQNYWIDKVLGRFYSGYSNNNSGSYLILGEQYGTITAYYNQWTTSNSGYGSYQWSSISIPQVDILYPPKYDDVENSGPSFNTFFISNNFIAYDYVIETKGGIGERNFLSTGQVAFLSNGIVQNVVAMPIVVIPQEYAKEFDYSEVFNAKGEAQIQISYQLGCIESSDDNYGYPQLFAPWGGIIGFLGQPGNKGFDENYQKGIQYALSFGLCMAMDNCVEGNVTDYVINQVSVEDGYQTYNTYFQFMPQQAVYDRTLNSIRYNQTRVAQGADSFANSAKQYGWTEYYFYNGGIYYAGSPYGELPYDPAATSNNSSFNQANANQTNAAQYANLMSGQLYCQRTLISQGGDDMDIGYEVARQQIFYKGFALNPYDNTGNKLSNLQVVSIVPTLYVNYSTANITNYPSVDTALANNAATLSYSYRFYDVEGAYGPWLPSDSNSQFYTWLDATNKAALNTLLPLGKLVYNYKLLDNVTTLEAIYTQYLPGFLGSISTLHGGNDYANFAKLNLVTPRVQTITWELSGLSTDTLPTPATTWNSDNWQIVSSQVTTWNYFTAVNSQANVWYPSSSYKWQGNLDGSALTSQPYFPWGTPPSNQTANTVWVQADSTTNVASNGILLSKQSNIGTPTTYLYDQQYFKNIAAFTNAGLANGVAFYLGFEVFENLSNWILTDSDQKNLIFNFSTLSYTGNRSLVLIGASTAVNYNLTFTPSSSILNDNRNWLLSVTVYNTTIDNAITLQAIANNSVTLITQNVALNAGWSTVDLLINFANNSITTIDNLTIQFSLSANSGNILVDNLYSLPTTQAGFVINSYDSVNKQLITSADLTDRQFNTRHLYDNLQRPIGSLRKNATELNQIDVIQLASSYFSRNGNNDNFNADDPNSLFKLTAGMNNSAGYYFDFRDGQNPWGAGTVQDRLLLLETNDSATFQLPTNNSYGFGIQLQIQGYVQNYSYSLSSGYIAKGLPTPTPAYSGAVWGCYATDPDSNDFNFYSLTYDGGSSNGIVEHDTSLPNSSAVYEVNGQLLISTEQNPYFGVFQNEAGYSLYNLFVGGSKSIVSASTNSSFFAVSLAKNSLLYIADNNNALYSVDVGSLNNANSKSFTPVTVCNYSTILANSVCSVQPVAGGPDNNFLVMALTANSQSKIVLVDTNSNNYFTLANSLNDTFQLPLAMDALGSIFAIGASNTVYAFDNNLNSVAQLTLPATPSYQPIAGNGVVAIVFSGGQLNLYNTELVLIAQINIDGEIVNPPIINGNKISIIGENTNSDTKQFNVYTYNTAGLLVTAPYNVTNATQSLAMAAYSGNSALTLMADSNNFSGISLAVPSASISMGEYTVQWDADNNQFTLIGPSDSQLGSATVMSTQGNWLFVLVNPVLYFYVDGQQIFAVTLDISTLPSGDFAIKATEGSISCRDIVLLNDPTLSANYSDGEGKTRQTQQTAEIAE